MPPVPVVRPVVSVVAAAQARELGARPLDAVLTGPERDQLARFGSEKRRQDWLAGRLAGKAEVAEWFRINGERLPEQVEIFNGPEGAPCLSMKRLAPLHLSLAHGALGGVAAVHIAPVGVDAELVSRRDAAVLAYFVREDESAADPRAQTALWTVKEAVLKMLGLGFAGGLLNVRWDGGPSAELFGAAQERRLELGIESFAVEQWFEGETSFCLSFAQPKEAA